MNKGSIIWLIIFAVSAIVFLVIAVIVSVRGFADLQSLLQHSNRRDEFDKDTTEKISE